MARVVSWIGRIKSCVRGGAAVRDTPHASEVFLQPGFASCPVLLHAPPFADCHSPLWEIDAR